MRASDDEENTDAQTGRSGSVPSWGSRKFIDLKRKNQFIIRAKYLLLTYSQVDEDEFNPLHIKHLIDGMGGKCRIGRELHKNGGVHYHAFCVKEKRFITRDPRKFDLHGFHPNIEPILRTPEKAWAYAVKEGNVIIDDIPERPIGRSRSTKKEEVWNDAHEQSKSADDMLNYLIKGDAKRAICAFNNVYAACQHLFPTTNYSEYVSPAGLAYEYGDYPQIANWQQRYLTQHTPTPINTYPVQESSTPETNSIHSGEDDGMASSDTSCTSFDTLFGPDCELARYETTKATTIPTLTNKQHRPKCLCIIGPSRLGKTLVARSFGPHSYFHGNWNIEQYNPNAIYNIFDDIKGQLDGFDFKSFLGGQHDITVTDKYHKKKTIKNGKPAIYLSNHDPLTTRRGRENRPWLLSNCIFVYIDKPICNIARETLEYDALEDALMCM